MKPNEVNYVVNSQMGVMDPQVERVKTAINELKAAVAALNSELPSLYLRLENRVEALDADDIASSLQNQLMAILKRKMALEKLTPQDRQILGLHA